MNFQSLSHELKEALYHACSEHWLCREKFYGGVSERTFFFLCKNVTFDSTTRFSPLPLYELMAKFPTGENDFCAGFNEFPVFSNHSNTWTCACKNPQSQMGCATSYSMENTDSSVQVYYAILSLILIFLFLILCSVLIRYCYDLVHYNIKEKSVSTAVKRVLYLGLYAFSSSFIRSSLWAIVSLSAAISLSFSASVCLV